MLILSPTRELAMQIAAVMTDAGAAAGLATVCAYGGVPKHTQATALRKGVHVIVATPGRLKVCSKRHLPTDVVPSAACGQSSPIRTMHPPASTVSFTSRRRSQRGANMKKQCLVTGNVTHVCERVGPVQMHAPVALLQS